MKDYNSMDIKELMGLLEKTIKAQEFAGADWSYCAYESRIDKIKNAISEKIDALNSLQEKVDYYRKLDIEVLEKLKHLENELKVFIDYFYTGYGHNDVKEKMEELVDIFNNRINN